MLRQVVLGILIGFGATVLFLAAFGARGAFAPAPVAAADAGTPPAPIAAAAEDAGAPCESCPRLEALRPQPVRAFIGNAVRPHLGLRAADAGR